MYVTKDGWQMEENPFKPPKEEHRIIAGNWTPKVDLMTDRDTKFLGFAKLLWDDLETAIADHYGFIPEGERLRRDFLPLMQKLIAQRAYDLAVSIMSDYQNVTIGTVIDIGLLDDVSDLAEWPKTADSPDSE